MTGRRERGAAAQRFGRWAEALCRLRLRLGGWRVLAVRERTPVGELDIVAVRGDVLAMIEVKGRPSLEAALEALSPQQRRRLCRAACAWLARHPAFSTRSIRFDLMLVWPWRWPRHLADAWRPEPDWYC